MLEKFEKKDELKLSIQLIYDRFKNDLHKLGLGEVAGEDERDFDFKNLGLTLVEKMNNRGEFKFNYDVAKIRELIKCLEKSLREGGEQAWQMPEREDGKYLEACFAGLEYVEDPKELLATLVFRLTKNHPCEDGNKRISTVMFLQALLENGMTIEEIDQAVDVEEFGMVMSQVDSTKVEEVRKKINNFLSDQGYE